MAERTDVKALMLEVDARIELLRANLRAGDGVIDRFAKSADTKLARVDKRFAGLGRPATGMAAHVRQTNAAIQSIGTTTANVEAQVRRSAGGMRTALLASAGTLSAVFTADRAAAFADAYTRYTNQLKVAGLEGEALSRVQERLFQTAQRYGVELEGVGTLFGRLSQSRVELGASEADLLRFTNGVAAALKVQGGDPAAAQGALLQLSQAMGGAIVRAEEFNSINEGARPILQAVANGIERFGGSVTKLRGEVIEGKLSSQEFFQGFLNGSAQLEQQATRAQLTIGASFTVLNNALAKYVGEADKGLGATTIISNAIVGLADNLEELDSALAVIAVGFAARFAAGPILGAVAAAATLRTELASQNLVLLAGKTAQAQRAQAAATAAAAEVAAIEATIAARRQDAAQLAANLALIERQRAEALQAQAAVRANAAAGLGTVGITRSLPDAARANQDLKAQITTKKALAIANAEIAASETALAAAQARAGVAARASTEATKAATLAARAGAVASKLLAGSLALVGGPAGLAVLALAAVVTAVLTYRSEVRDAAADNALLDRNTKDLNETLEQLGFVGGRAGAAISTAGNNAVTAAGQMRQFAGEVGEAARRLVDLAKQRRDSARAALQEPLAKAILDERNAQTRIDAIERRRAQTNGAGYRAAPIMLTQRERDEEADARASLARAQGNRMAIGQAWSEIRRRPLEAELTDVDRNGGRDVDGDLARTRRDLTIARQRGNRAQIADLQAQQFELTQFKKYRADGLSAEAALSQAQRDAADFRSASGERAAGRAAAGARRETAAAARQEAAAVRDAAGDARAYASAERQAGNDIAAARAELSNSAVERAAIEKARINAERINRNDEIETQGPGGLQRFTAAQVAALQALNDQRADLETQAVDLAERRRIDREALEVLQAGLGNQQDLLRTQANLARTSDERRALELRILDIQYDEERARLRAVTVANGATDAEAQIAQARLAMLDQLKAGDRESIRRNTAGPLESYIDALPQNAAEAAEAVEAIAVDKLRSLNDEILDVLTGAKSIEDAFGDMARSIIADLARIAIQQAIIKPLAESLFGGMDGGSSGGGSIFGSLGSLLSGSSLPGRAGGGSVYPGQDVIVGERGPERVRFRQSARVIPNSGLRTPGVSRAEAQRAQAPTPIVRIEPSPMFDVVVDGRARAIAEPLAVQAAQQGAQAGFEAAIGTITRQGL